MNRNNVACVLLDMRLCTTSSNHLSPPEGVLGDPITDAGLEWHLHERGCDLA
jgi:hypothetical protein